MGKSVEISISGIRRRPSPDLADPGSLVIRLLLHRTCWKLASQHRNWGFVLGRNWLILRRSGLKQNSTWNISRAISDKWWVYTGEHLASGPCLLALGKLARENCVAHAQGCKSRTGVDGQTAKAGCRNSLQQSNLKKPHPPKLFVNYTHASSICTSHPIPLWLWTHTQVLEIAAASSIWSSSNANNPFADDWSWHSFWFTHLSSLMLLGNTAQITGVSSCMNYASIGPR